MTNDGAQQRLHHAAQDYGSLDRPVGELPTRTAYQPPVVEALGHWQVHTMQSQSEGGDTGGGDTFGLAWLRRFV